MITQYTQISFYVGQSATPISGLSNVSNVDKIYDIDSNGNYIGYLDDFSNLPFLQGLTNLQPSTGYIVVTKSSATLPYQLFPDETEITTDTELAAVSGVLQGGIDNVNLFSNAVFQTLQSASGVLDGEITVVSGDVSFVSGELITASGALQDAVDVLDTSVTDLDTKYLNASGYLQSQVTSNSGNIDIVSGIMNTDIAALNVDVTNLENDLDSVSGEMINRVAASGQAALDHSATVSGLLVASSGNLSNRISDNASNIAFVSGEIITASGALKDQIDNITVDLAPTEGRIDFVSGELITASGALRADITTAESDIDFVSGELITASGALRTDVDLKATDIMSIARSGALQSYITTVSGILDIDIATASGALRTDVDLKATEADSVARSGNLQAQITTASGALNADMIASGTSLQSQITTIENDTAILAILQDIDDIIGGTNATDLNTFLTSVNNASAFVSGEIITVSGALRDDVNLKSTEADSVARSGNLQAQITTATGALQADVDLKATEADSVARSGNLQGQITTASGALQADIDALSSLDLEELGNLADILGSNADLASLISGMESDITTNASDIDFVSGELITASGALRSGINEVDTDVISLSGQMVSLTDAAAQSLNFNVTVFNDNGVNKYRFNGCGTTDSNNPDLYLHKGLTYYLNVDAATHPFWIKTDSGIGTDNVQSDGVTNNGAENGTVIFTVPQDAPSVLYYNCQYHELMAGKIYTAVDSVPSVNGGLADTYSPFGTTTVPPTATTTAAPTYSNSVSSTGAGLVVDNAFVGAGLEFMTAATGYTMNWNTSSLTVPSTWASSSYRKHNIYKNGVNVVSVAFYALGFLNDTDNPAYELELPDGSTYTIGWNDGTLNSGDVYDVNL